MDTRDGQRLITTLIGGGFLVYAAVVVLRGTLHDVDDGRVTRAAGQVAFWLLVPRSRPSRAAWLPESPSSR